MCLLNPFQEAQEKRDSRGKQKLALAKKQAELKDPEWNEEMSANETYSTSVKTSRSLLSFVYCQLVLDIYCYSKSLLYFYFVKHFSIKAISIKLVGRRQIFIHNFWWM